MSENKYVSLIAFWQKHRVNYQTAWRAVVSGTVVAVREGREWRIPEGEIEGLKLACRGDYHEAA